MSKFTLLLSPLLFLTALALPSPSKDLLPRACATQGPSIIDVLRSSNPNTPSPGQQFILSRSGSPASNQEISVLTFEYIPTGATGCMLEIEIPPLSQSNQIASGTATQADIWTTDPWGGNHLPTWNTQPRKREMVATFRFPTETSTSVFRTVLASNVCNAPMSFLVELSAWQTGAGSVNFYNSLGGKQGLQVQGFKMVYNC